MPSTHSVYQAATGNIVVCKYIIDIMVAFDPQYTFLPVKKSYCDEIVATKISNTSPPTSLPILCKSGQFDPPLNDTLRPPSAQTSNGFSPRFNIYIGSASSSSCPASSSEKNWILVPIHNPLCLLVPISLLPLLMKG